MFTTSVYGSGVTRGDNAPGAESLLGLRKVATMSQVLSLVQLICFRKSSGSNMRVPDLLLEAGAI